MYSCISHSLRPKSFKVKVKISPQSFDHTFSVKNDNLCSAPGVRVMPPILVPFFLIPVPFSFFRALSPKTDYDEGETSYLLIMMKASGCHLSSSIHHLPPFLENVPFGPIVPFYISVVIRLEGVPCCLKRWYDYFSLKVFFEIKETKPPPLLNFPTRSHGEEFDSVDITAIIFTPDY